MSNSWPLPTILIAGSSPQISDVVAVLQCDGFLVLESRDENETINIIRLHSRPIHATLIDESTLDRNLASRLNLYRPRMHVVFIDCEGRQNVSAKLREVLALLKADGRLPGIKPTNGNGPSDRAPIARRHSA
jgi:hypothetical protein